MKSRQATDGVSFALLIILAGILLGSMAGCVTEHSSLGTVVRVLTGDRYVLDKSGEEVVNRFNEVFLDLSSDDSEDSVEHFIDAFKRVRTQYVSEVRDESLNN